MFVRKFRNFLVNCVVKLLMVTLVMGRLQPVTRPHFDVTIIQGRVRGYYSETPPHYQYFGIPYAKPPTRRDRFKAPKPPPNWDGIFEASHKIRCPQQGVTGEENCLVVNVFRPRHSSTQPVLVFIHDGHFQSGWGKYEAPARFLAEGFVVVTFNYRFGALGFLCLATADAPGNAGLKDQIAALYWVHRNIAAFGGNPNDVTLYGIGTGAASAELLIMSGLAKDLVHRIIAESGAVLSPSSMIYESISTAFSGAKFLGYPGTDDPEELYEFYQEVEVNDIVTIPDLFLPCVENLSLDNSLIDSDPLHKLKMANFDKVPILYVINEHDSVILVKNSMEYFEKYPQNFIHMLPSNLEFDDEDIKTKVAGYIKDFYFGEEVNHKGVTHGYTNYIHDVFTEYPIVKFSMLYSSNDSGFVYVMKFKVNGMVDREDSFKSGVGTVLEYIEKADEVADETVLVQLMTLWKNFLKLGDPTPLTSSVVPIMWQPATTYNYDNPGAIATSPMLLFSETGMKMSTTPSQHLLLWDNVYSKFYKPYGLEDISTEYDNEEQ